MRPICSRSACTAHAMQRLRAEGFTQPRSGYETKWFTQSLTHVPSDTRTFRQRYLVESYVGRGTRAAGPAPVLFYAGNEGPIDGFWASADSSLSRSEAGAPSCSSRKPLPRRERARARRQVARDGAHPGRLREPGDAARSPRSRRSLCSGAATAARWRRSCA